MGLLIGLIGVLGKGVISLVKLVIVDAPQLVSDVGSELVKLVSG